MQPVFLNDLNGPEAAPYARLTRAELKQAGKGRGLFIAESIPVIAAALEAGHAPVSVLAEEKHLKAIEQAFPRLSCPVYTSGPDALEALTGFRMSRGVLCAMERKPLPSAGEVLRGARRVAVLEALMDPTNVGAIFRSAAALGMDAVLLSESCCEPLHRRAARVSMGAVFRVPWAVLPCKIGAAADLSPLRGAGFTLAAMALSAGGVRLTDPKLHSAQRLAVLIGAEGSGLDPATISACDMTVTVPMARGVDSLNAAAAAAVAFWELGSAKESE